MMKSLGGSSLKLFSCKQRAILCSREFGPSKQEIVFLGHQKRVNDGFGRLISPQNKFIHSISAAASAQKNVGSEEIHTIYSDSTKTVHVRFKLNKECAFGEHFFIVGDDPILGLWEPSDGVPLNWSDGHIWTADMDIPIGKVIKYKFILKGDTETILWQPGPDRILETRESEKMITVLEDWDNPELQNIVEEDIVLTEDSLIDADLLIVDENSNLVITDEGRDVANIIPDEGPDAIKELENVNGGYINHEEKISLSPPMVAENITVEQDLSSNDDGPALVSITDQKKDEVINLSSSKNETKLVLDEGVPVLVPGLIPMSFDERNKEEEINDAEPSLIPMSFEEISEPEEVINDPELLNEVEKSEVESKSIEPDEVEELTMAELKDEHVSDASLHSTESNEMISTINEKQQTSEQEQAVNNILETDKQWGRRTLQKFLANFGFQ
ncbi:hypothetical protein BUALT_Bualt11G0128200 [Buddleja alternifolia]|uniref:CBM20 domain-containing protein n=1 Tax=Buddleja alternifolia TaxID=168488 RepID=A0AAV6WW03_9LAMI|nr:hypothetical protein BUALT_Bualt11G0128200 [Buddleja alternifolia]